MTTKIFINYRREDSAADARSIYQWLEQRFGVGAIFMDTDGIKKGDDFEATLASNLSDCAALVSVIGEKWLDVRDQHGNRRLDNPNDFVRIELATALERNIPIIPVLIGHAEMPPRAALPGDISAVTSRMAAFVSHETFNSDMQALELELAPLVGRARRIDELTRHVRWQRRLIAAVLVLLAGLIVVSRAELADFSDRMLVTAAVFGSGKAPPLDPIELKRLQEEILLAKSALEQDARKYMTQIKPDPKGNVWSWAVAQAAAASPFDSDDLRATYFKYIEANINKDCDCFIVDNVRHSVTTAWVIISYARMQQDIPERIVRGLLSAQSALGWWSAALDARQDDAHASVYVTALALIALKTLQSTGLAKSESYALKSAIEKAGAWLSQQAPDANGSWLDYPKSQRGTPNNMFGAMVLVALDGLDGQALSVAKSRLTKAFWTTYSGLPDAHLYFSSDNWISTNSGGNHIDKYRHVPYPWIALALISIYEQMPLAEKVRIVRDIRRVVQHDYQNPAFRRQEWLLAEHVFIMDLLLLKSRGLTGRSD